MEITSEWKTIIWQQFGAAIDMLENAIKNCPEELWNDRTKKPEFWYIAYHTLFWLDFYLTESPDEFIPPPSYTLSELDPEGILPERLYSKNELLAYLEQSRKKCREIIKSFSNEKTNRQYVYGSVNLNSVEMLLYNMRHVQHHAAQLNLLLRLNIDSAPRYVKKTLIKL